MTSASSDSGEYILSTTKSWEARGRSKSHQLVVADRRLVDEENAIGEIVEQLGSDLERQTCLARAAWAGQRDSRTSARGSNAQTEAVSCSRPISCSPRSQAVRKAFGVIRGRIPRLRRYSRHSELPMPKDATDIQSHDEWGSMPKAGCPSTASARSATRLQRACSRRDCHRLGCRPTRWWALGRC